MENMEPMYVVEDGVDDVIGMAETNENINDIAIINYDSDVENDGDVGEIIEEFMIGELFDDPPSLFVKPERKRS